MELNARTAIAGDFDTVAQRHANSFWSWLLTTVAVYYFFDWWAIAPGLLMFWAAASSVGSTIQAKKLRDGTYLIPNPNNGAPKGDATSTPGADSTQEKMQQVLRIINQYGAFLMSEAAPDPGCVADTSKLPFPKQLLKAALLVGIKTSNDAAATGSLIHAYLDLANFQDGVGDTDIGISMDTLKGHGQDLVDKVLQQSERLDEFSGKVLLEVQALSAELKDAGVQV